MNPEGSYAKLIMDWTNCFLSCFPITQIKPSRTVKIARIVQNVGPDEVPNSKAMPAFILGDVWVQSIEHSTAQFYVLV